MMAEIGNPWSLEQVQQLRKLVRENTPLHVISIKLHRGEEEIQAKALELGLVLKPAVRQSTG